MKHDDMGHFIIAAITREGSLYQLASTGAKATSKGKQGKALAYAAYEVDESGCMHLRAGTGFPCPSKDKAEAVERFRAWARGKGHEIYGGS
jgi:hypothetical protein